MSGIFKTTGKVKGVWIVIEIKFGRLATPNVVRWPLLGWVTVEVADWWFHSTWAWPNCTGSPHPNRYPFLSTRQQWRGRRTYGWPYSQDWPRNLWSQIPAGWAMKPSTDDLCIRGEGRPTPACSWGPLDPIPQSCANPQGVRNNGRARWCHTGNMLARMPHYSISMEWSNVLLNIARTHWLWQMRDWGLACSTESYHFLYLT